MKKQFLLALLFSILSSYTVHAQLLDEGDPSVANPVLSPSNTIPTGTTGTVSVNFGNSSATAAIPQSSTAVYTVQIPFNLGVQGASITVPAGTTANLTLTVGPYVSGGSTTITITSDLGPVPIGTIYTLKLNVIGVYTTPGATITSNASSITPIFSNDPTNDNGTEVVIVPFGIALPVSLVSFTAKPLSNRTVEVAWTTSWETKNKGFLIEHSKDLKLFEKVGEVTEIGSTSSVPKNYYLTDLAPYSGTSYYRLTQIDLDGKATVFPAVSVVLRDGAYGVYPNPVVSDQPFSLSLDEPDMATVNFYSAAGRILPLQKAGVQSGNLLLKIPGKLPTGIYILTVEERGQMRKHRLVVE